MSALASSFTELADEIIPANTARAAVQASMDGFAILDQQGRYVYLNEAHARIYGYESEAELRGRTWRELYHAEEIERFENSILPRLAQEGRWLGEALGKKKNGTAFTQELSLSQMPDGGLVCVVRDVSARRSAEEALALLNHVIAAAVQHSGCKEIAQACLEEICRVKSWLFGAAWMRFPGETSLRWLCGCGELPAPRALGSPTEVAQEALRPVLTQRGSFSGIAIPVAFNGNGLVVLEFYSSGHVELDESLLYAFTRLTSLLSPIFGRDRARSDVERYASLLKATLDSTADGIAVTTLDQKLTLYNEKLGEIWGLDESALRRGELKELRQQVAAKIKNFDHVIERTRTFYKNAEITTNDIIELYDGRIIERHSTPHRVDGNVIGRVWSFRDVTASWHAEQERNQTLCREQNARTAAEFAEGRAKLLAEASALLDASLDFEGTLRTAARVAVPRLADWCAIDLPEDEQCFRRMAIAHVDPSKEEHRRALERSYEADRNVWQGAFKVIRTGQAEVIEEITQNSLRAVAPSADAVTSIAELGLKSYMCLPLKARGRTIGAITFAWASSQRKYTPADLGLADDIAHRAALAIDNAKLYREAQEAIQARHEFISVASHEMRTPLTSLLGYIQLVTKSYMRPEPHRLPPERVLTLLKGAENQCLKLVTFMTDLLDVSKISARGIKLETERFDLVDLVRECIEKVRHAYDVDQLPISLESDAGGAHGVWDRLRLDQVVTNLLTNAVKYGERKPVQIRIEQAENLVRLLVTDHGIGISPENQARVFQRFERAVSARSFKGTGLGLWITRSIVEAHGGSITLVSRLGQGSTFRVELPRCVGTQKNTSSTPA